MANDPFGDDPLKMLEREMLRENFSPLQGPWALGCIRALDRVVLLERILNSLVAQHSLCDHTGDVWRGYEKAYKLAGLEMPDIWEEDEEGEVTNDEKMEAAGVRFFMDWPLWDPLRRPGRGVTK